jgi:multiple sugar transport system substrate-binding protein
MGGRLRWAVAGMSVVVTAASGCSVGSSQGASQVSADAQQTIVFAVQGGTTGGLGSEGQATADEITAFEQLHPNITVSVQALPSTGAHDAVVPLLSAGSGTPDVIDADTTWCAQFGKAGWIQALNFDTSQFYSAQVADLTSWQGKLYGLTWYMGAEGLYYRTDLVPKAPASPDEVVADAAAALKADPSLKEGIAFEGSKYEGAVTAFMMFLGGFGGKLDVANLDTPQVRQALQYMNDLIYKDNIAPQAVAGWTEDDSAQAFTSGQAPFAFNWPYVLQGANADGSAIAGKTGWIPFPSATGQPIAPLGGDALVMNAKSSHQAAAWEFMQFLMDPAQQNARAIASGDTPSVRAAFNDALFAKAPYFKQETAVFDVAMPRPVSPHYPEMSAALQLMINSVLTNQSSINDAVTQAASTLKTLS